MFTTNPQANLDNETHRKLAKLSHVQSKNYSKEGQSDLALEYSLMAIQTLKTIPSDLLTDEDHRLFANFYLQTGCCYDEKENIDEANNCFTNVIDCLKDITNHNDDDRRYLASAKISLAGLCDESKKSDTGKFALYSEAIQLLEKIKKEKRSDQDNRWLSACYYDSAKQFSSEQIDDRLKYYTRSRQYSYKISNPTEEDYRIQANCLNRIAVEYSQLGSNTEAHEYFKLSEEALEKSTRLKQKNSLNDQEKIRQLVASHKHVTEEVKNMKDRITQLEKEAQSLKAELNSMKKTTKDKQSEEKQQTNQPQTLSKVTNFFSPIKKYVTSGTTKNGSGDQNVKTSLLNNTSINSSINSSYGAT